LDIYYLFLHLQERPELSTTVNALLQPGVFSDSSRPKRGIDESQSTASLTAASLGDVASKKKSTKKAASDVSVLTEHVSRLADNMGSKRELNEEERMFFKRKSEQENEKHHVDQYDRLEQIITRLEDQLERVTKPEKKLEIQNDIDKLKREKNKYLDKM
jgi:polyhydroxyalkanoate synthesis regulator phasin